MEITCLQMDVLISFYIDGDLSDSLKTKVEKHLKECSICRAKYNIVSSLFADFKKEKKEEVYSTNTHPTKQYQFFKNNLSAYVDNELPEEENVKMKKYTITNKKARKDLEETYRIRKLMRDSFRKTKNESKPDFSKNILKQIDSEYKNELNFNPLLMVAFAFVLSILLIGSFIIYILTL